MMEDPFTGNLYVVTGASKGIGLKITEALIKRGAEVIGVARSEEILRELKERYEGFSYITMDLTREKSGLELAREVEGLGVKGLVNNAGYAWWGDPLMAPLDEVRSMTQLMFLTPVELSTSLIDELKGGVVVNLISSIVHVKMRYLTAYGAAKTALHYYTVSSREFYKKRGVHLMGVYPGPVNTDFFSHPSFPAGGTFIQRFAITPERVARAVIKGIERKQKSIYVPWYLRILSFK